MRFSPTAGPTARPIPAGPLAALRRAWTIAQDSGNRTNRTDMAAACVEGGAAHDDPLASFDYVSMAIRHYTTRAAPTSSTTPVGILTAVSSTGSDARTSGHHRRVRRTTPMGLVRATPKSTPQSCTCARSRRIKLYEPLARAGEAMTGGRHGGVRIRPDRPGPSETETRREIDEHARVSKVRRNQDASTRCCFRAVCCESSVEAFSLAPWIASGSGRGIGTGRGTRGRYLCSRSPSCSRYTCFVVSCCRIRGVRSLRRGGRCHRCHRADVRVCGGSSRPRPRRVLSSNGQRATRSIRRKHWQPPMPGLGRRLSEWWRPSPVWVALLLVVVGAIAGAAGRGWSNTGSWVPSSELPSN